MTTDSIQHSEPIILFDGVCGLCNKSVDFIIAQDQKGIFKFASLQSDFAKNELNRYQFSSIEMDSVILLYQEEHYTKTKAAAKILKLLGGIYSILGTIIGIVPVRLGDVVYDWIARNRYKWFGTLPSCRIPTENERSRFLD